MLLYRVSQQSSWTFLKPNVVANKERNCFFYISLSGKVNPKLNWEEKNKPQTTILALGHRPATLSPVKQFIYSRSNQATFLTPAPPMKSPYIALFIKPNIGFQP